MSQPHPRQQQSSNDTRWKQHLIAKKIQEFQQQNQFQQIHLGARQQNSLNHIYGTSKQTAVDELPAMLSGMPIANGANYMPAELMRGESNSPSSSHMFIAGNMNWGPRNMPGMPGIQNGLIFSQDQGQMMDSVGYVSRQQDQSLPGTPVSSSLGPLNHFLQLQGMSHDGTSADFLPKLGEKHPERSSMQSFAFNHFPNDLRAVPNEGYSTVSVVSGRQGVQGNSLFGNTLPQDTKSGTPLGNIQQLNHLTDSARVQEFQAGQEQTDWSGKSLQSMAAHVAPSNGATSLDPTEEKLLFGVDDDANWDASSRGRNNRVAGSYLNGYPIQNNECLNEFPSHQCGTWSALVQEALEVSSSDTGHPEEWSGLSIQVTEPQAGYHSVLSCEDGKQNAVRDGNSNLHNMSSLTSKPFAFFSDAASQSFHSVPGSQQPINFSYEQNERLEKDQSFQSVQHLSKESSDIQFDHNHQPYNFLGNGLQDRQQQQDGHNGVWATQTHQQTMHSADSAEIGLNSQEMQHSWTQQQKIPFHHINRQSGNRLSGWGIESPSASVNHIFKIYENGDMNQFSRINDSTPTMHVEMTGRVGESKVAASTNSLEGQSVKSDTNKKKTPDEHTFVANFADSMNPNSFRSNMVMNQQLLNRHPVIPVKRPSDLIFARDNKENLVNHQKQLSAGPQDWDLSSGCTHKESGESYCHGFSTLHPNDNTGDERNEKDDSLAGNYHFSLISGGQKLSDHSDRKLLGSRGFQFHPLGNLEINLEPANQENRKSLSQGPSQPVIWGLKNQEKEQFGNSQFVGHVASTNSDSIVTGKDCYIDSRGDATIAEMSHAGTFLGHIPNISSFTATLAHFPQDKRSSFPSQSVPVLFHKPDQSDDCSTAAQQSISDNNVPSGTPEGVTSDGSTSYLQHNQSNTLQSSGLKLAPSSPTLSASGHSLNMHTSMQRVNNFDPRSIHSVAEAAHRAWSSSNTSTVALPTIHEASPNENLDKKLVMSAQASKEHLYSNIQENSLGMTTQIRNQSIVHQQQQQQDISNASRLVQFDQSADQSFGMQVEVDGLLRHPHAMQVHGSCERSLTDQTSQASLPGLLGKVPFFKLASFTGNGAPIPPQFYSQDRGHSEMINAHSNLRNTGQQHFEETVSHSQPSTTSVVSQQHRFPNFFNDVWRNAATQQPSGLMPQKFAPNLLQSMNSLPSPQQADDPNAKKVGNASSEVGTCSINSPQFTYGEEDPSKNINLEPKPATSMEVSPRRVGASQMQEKFSDKSSVSSVSSLVHLHQYNIKKGKHADNHRENVNFPTISTSIDDAQKHNYSLLQQMLTMKGIVSDPSMVAAKRFKGTDCSADDSTMDCAGGERYICEQNAFCRESDAALYPKDVKMLSFSSRENEERNANASSHLIVGELASPRQPTSSRQQELQNSSPSSSIPTLTGGNEWHPINPQISSWFEQCRGYKDNQISAMSDSIETSQRTVKADAQHYFLSKAAEPMDNVAITENRDNNIPENLSPAGADVEHYSSSSMQIADEKLVMVRKKRKIATSELFPWHKDVAQSSLSLRSLSMAEEEWAQATNRVVQKIEDDIEPMDEIPPTTRLKRRLVLTTQLMQQVFSPVPAKFLITDAMTSYEKVIYYIAKLTLGEVCSLISVLENDSCLQLECGNMISEKHSIAKKTRDESFSDFVENFIARSRQLQSNFFRLVDGGSSIVDARIECQDVEQCSIINRFAKFHGRGPRDMVEGSSTSVTAPRRSFLQRNVTVAPMPRNLPDGVICLSL